MLPRHAPKRLIHIASRMLLWMPPLLWAGVIFWLSSIPGTDLPPTGFSSLAHVVVYLILSALIFIALRPGVDRASAICLAILLASAYGVTDEIHQSFVPNRTPDIADWGFDTIGAAIGAWLGILVDERLAARKK